MRTIPKPISDALTFFRTHLPLWDADPSAVGLTSQQVDTLTALFDDALAAHQSAAQAQSAARSATLRQTVAMRALRGFGGDIVATIRAFAEITDNRAVYSTANIAPPRDPSPLGAPETPTHLTLTLDNAGRIHLTWNGSREGGTSFLIERSLTGATGDWTILGSAETRSFTDHAVPSGLPYITYRVRALRSGGASSPTSPMTILFGNVTQRSSRSPSLARAA